jgi:hypothetical protein
MVQIAAKQGHHVNETAALKELVQMRQRAEDLRVTGIRGKDLIEYVCTGLMRSILNRELMTRDEAWYRDSIELIVRISEKPHLAAVLLMEVAESHPDPTRGLAENRDHASKYFQA